jgi:hypothetical protein
MGTAAADVALQGQRNFGWRGIGILLQKSDAAHDHAGGAVSALEGFGVKKSLLDGVKAARLFEALDGGNRLAGNRRDGKDAGATRRTIEQNRTGAALAFAAAVFGAGQAQSLAEYA